MQNLDQIRSKHAWDAVARIKSNDKDKYKQQVMKMPARIVTSGLGQALTFVKEKGEAPQLLTDLASYCVLRNLLDNCPNIDQAERQNPTTTH
jgi:CRISPR type III-B/RAMP module-associated protein Cmr5